jgi:DNA-binding phage protein
MTMPLKTRPFDEAAYLTDAEMIVGFLREVIESGDTAAFPHAFDVAARAAKAIKNKPTLAKPSDEENPRTTTG